MWEGVAVAFSSFDFQEAGGTLTGTFGIFPRPHERSWGISFVKLPEPFAHPLKIAVVKLAELGGKAAMVDSASLME